MPTSRTNRKGHHPPRLSVGYARTEITPPVGSPLSGVIALKGRFATSIHDPLFARALTVRLGAKETTVLVADLLCISARLHRAVADRVGLPLESILTSATHTHSGPGGYWDAGPRAVYITGPYREVTFREIVARLADAVERSRRRLEPAELLASRHALVGANANRRRLHGAIDPDLTLLRFKTTQGEPIDLVSFSAHPVVASEREPLAVSADFPGELCARLERRGVRPLFFQGAVGALSPLFTEFPMTLEPHLALVGDLLERGWHDAVASLKPVPPDPLEFRILRVELPPPRCRLFPDSMPLHLLADGILFPLRRWAQGMAERGRSVDPDAPLHLLRIGRVALLGTPCDLGVNVALALKKVLSGAGIEFPIVGSQCDGYVGYVLMPEDYEHVPERGFRELGFYENGMSFGGWRLGADFVETLRSSVHGNPG